MTEDMPKSVLAQGGEATFPFAMKEPLSDGQRAEFAHGKAVYIDGWIGYRDAFKQRWRTRFRFFQSVRAAFPEYNTMAMCDEGNTESLVSSGTPLANLVEGLRRSIPSTDRGD